MVEFFSLMTVKECLEFAIPQIIPFMLIYVVGFIFYLIGEALERGEVEADHPAFMQFQKLKALSKTFHFVFKLSFIVATVICLALYKGWWGFR